MIVYVDQSRIRSGKLAELERGMAELAAFVEANEPDLIAYHVYLSEDRRRVTVLHVHADPGTLRFHLDTAGPLFAPFGDLLELVRIDVYGRPDDDLVERIRAKAEMLGAGVVEVHDPLAGYLRSR